MGKWGTKQYKMHMENYGAMAHSNRENVAMIMPDAGLGTASELQQRKLNYRLACCYVFTMMLL